MLFAWFMLAGLILLFSPHAVTSRFQFAFARFFHWPLRIGRNVSLSARTELPLSRQVGDFSRKETQYQNHIANLEEQLHQKNVLIRKLTGLRTRLRGLEGAKLVPADIITASAQGRQNELIINRGSDDGLSKDLFVIGNNSVIGTVTDLSARTARVRLFGDVSSAVGVNMPGLGINMLMQGNGNGLAKIKLVPVKHKIKVGDTVLIHSKPGYLDVSMIGGIVQQCRRDDGNPSLWDITVKPACDIATLNTVTVIVMNPASQ